MERTSSQDIFWRHQSRGSDRALWIYKCAVHACILFKHFFSVTHSYTARRPKALAIPTRFDPNWIWIATSESLILLDNSNETTMGVFHHNAIRIPTALTPGRRKSSHAVPPNHADIKPDMELLSSDSDSTPSLLSPSADSSQSSFFQSHIPGIGSNYLEYTPHPLAHDIEIISKFLALKFYWVLSDIVSFIVSSLMMEILRRGRFSLSPYTFNRPKAGQIKEARELMLRRLRRNTV